MCYATVSVVSDPCWHGGDVIDIPSVAAVLLYPEDQHGDHESNRSRGKTPSRSVQQINWLPTLIWSRIDLWPFMIFVSNWRFPLIRFQQISSCIPATCSLGIFIMLQWIESLNVKTVGLSRNLLFNIDSPSLAYLKKNMHRMNRCMSIENYQNMPQNDFDHRPMWRNLLQLYKAIFLTFQIIVWQPALLLLNYILSKCKAALNWQV